MKLEQSIELLNRSSERLMSALRDLRHDEPWLVFMQRESWLHLKLAFKTWWHVAWMSKEEIIRKK